MSVRPLLILVALATALRLLPLTFDERLAVVVLTAIGMLTTVVRSIRRYKPLHPSMWSILGGTGFAMGSSLGIRLLIPSAGAPHADGSPNVIDIICLISAIAIVGVVFRLGHLRRDPEDSTSLHDAVVLATGAGTVAWLVLLMPVMKDGRVSLSTFVFTTVLACVAISLLFGASRIALISSERTEAGRRLVLATMLGAATQVASLNATADMGPTALTFATMAVGVLGWAAYHPSMARLAEPGIRQTASRLDRNRSSALGIPRLRLALLASSSLVAPAGLLYMLADSHASLLVGGFLVSAWGLVAVLLAARFNNLLRYRDRAIAMEKRLTDNLTQITGMTSTDDATALAVSTAYDILNADRSATVGVILGEGDQASVVRCRGRLDLHGVHVDLGKTDFSAHDDGPLPDDQADSLIGGRRASVDHVFAIPLASPATTFGVLFAVAPYRLDAAGAIALRSIASALLTNYESIASIEAEARKKNERSLRALFEDIAGLHFVVTPDCKTVFRSASVDRLLGTKQDPFLSLLQLAHPDYRDRLAGTVSFCRVPGATDSMEVLLPAGPRWLSVTMSCQTDNDLFAGIAVHVTDITQRKRAQESQRSRFGGDERSETSRAEHDDGAG